MKFRDLEKKAKLLGFNPVRKASGSHKIYENEQGRRIVLPEHRGEISNFHAEKLLKGVNNESESLPKSP